MGEKQSKPYFWINKSSKSTTFSRSQGEEAYRILSFVQKQSAKKSKRTRSQKRARPGESTLSLAIDQVSLLSTLSRSDGRRVGQHSRSKWRLSELPDLETNAEFDELDRSSNLQTPPPDVSQSLSQQSSPRRRPRHLRPLIAKPSGEPFTQPVVLEPDCVPHALEDPVQPKTPTCGPVLAQICILAFRDMFEVAIPPEAEQLGLDLRQTKAHAVQLLYWSTEHEDILLGLSLLRLCYLPDFHRLDSSIRKVAEQVQSCLIKHMNQRIQAGRIDVLLVQVVIYLLLAEKSFGRREYGLVHWNGLQSIIKLQGGLLEVMRGFGKLGRNVFMSVLVIAIWMNTNPITLASHRDMSSLSSPPAIPPGFLRLAGLGYLSETSMTVIHSFLSWMKVHNHLPPSAWYPSIVEGHSVLEQAILYALLRISDQIAQTGDHVSVLLWRKRTRLCRSLFDVDELWAETSVRNILVWLLSALATPSRSALMPFEYQLELQEKMLHLYPELDKISNIENVLRLFVAPDAQLTLWKISWSCALQTDVEESI